MVFPLPSLGKIIYYERKAGAGRQNLFSPYLRNCFVCCWYAGFLPSSKIDVFKPHLDLEHHSFEHFIDNIFEHFLFNFIQYTGICFVLLFFTSVWKMNKRPDRTGRLVIPSRPEVFVSLENETAVATLPMFPRFPANLC